MKIWTDSKINQLTEWGPMLVPSIQTKVRSVESVINAHSKIRVAKYILNRFLLNKSSH